MSLLFVMGVILTSRERLMSLRRAAPNVQTVNPFDQEWQPAAKPSEWGLMGVQVRELRRWSDLGTDDPRADLKAVADATVALFPFCGASEGSSVVSVSSCIPPPSLTPPSEVGMVISVGSNNYRFASHLISSLRRVHRSEMPIEIAYAGDDDLKPRHRAYLQSLTHNLTFIDLLERFPTARSDLVDGGWATKPFAVLAARHSRAILVDADTVFFVAPDRLFETHAGLGRTGALFYHDRAVPGRNVEQQQYLESQLAVAGISHFFNRDSLFFQGQSWYEADSGMLAVDKTNPAVFFGLVFAAWMNTKAVREGFTYTTFHGDKDTFWIAMALSNASYSFDGRYAGSIGAPRVFTPSGAHPHAQELCGKHMLHMDPSGRVPFWMNGGIYRDKDAAEPQLAALTHYWAGNDENSPRPQWRWIADGVACIKARDIARLGDEIRRTLLRMAEEAQQVDARIADVG